MSDRTMLIGRNPDGTFLSIEEEDLRRHVFVSGSTGSGKTSLLLGMAANAIAWGSGCIFVDGKGDKAAYLGILECARRFGREDDVLLLDFTHEPDPAGKISHTINPFAQASATTICDMIIGLMDDVGGDGAMWKGRAIALITSIMRALTWKRDQGLLDLNVGLIRDHLNLEKIVSLADPEKEPDMPAQIRESVASYLRSLPGYSWEKRYKQGATTLDQHGFLQMQFTRLLSFLADDQGHIFLTPIGDIDLKDVVNNRRILVVLLPSGGRSSDQVAFLGHIIVTMLKDMLARAVRNASAERPAAPPFPVFLDEYGHYATEGVESLVSQGRSLGFAFVFSSQTLVPSSSDPEGHALDQVLANTATKIFMRTDLFDRERLARVVPAPLGPDDDLERLHLRNRMADLQALASMSPADKHPEFAREFADLMERVRSMENGGLAAGFRTELPSLRPGELICVQGAAMTKAMAFDMSGFRGPDRDMPWFLPDRVLNPFDYSGQWQTPDELLAKLPADAEPLPFAMPPTIGTLDDRASVVAASALIAGLGRNVPKEAR